MAFMHQWYVDDALPKQNMVGMISL